jgi:hypothetical protein
MATKICANPGVTPDFLRSPAKGRAFRYDNLGSVLVNLDEQVQLSDRRKQDRTVGLERHEIAELRANLASLKAENERLSERFADELDRVADRLTKLEARVHVPWWRRAFGLSRIEPEPAGGPSRKAVARLRALVLDQSAVRMSSVQR